MQHTTTNALRIVKNIQKALDTEQSDFEVIEEIINILETNGIHTNRHDF